MQQGPMKFAGEQSEDHGGPLQWPGTPDGYPVRGGQGSMLRQDEVAEIPVSLDFKFRIFHLWEPADNQAYQAIQDRISNGWYQLRFIHRDTSDLDKIRVYMEWCQLYGVLPNGKSTPSSGTVQQLAPPGKAFAR